MAAPDSTKFQINYKLSDGTLINLYATDVKELETGLTDLSMVAQLIKSTGTELGGSATASAVAALSAGGFAAPVESAPAAQGGNTCRHGAMVFKDGVNAQGKPWKAYMCSAPRGAADKCDPIWIR